ncbi:MAG TPA: alpha/beta fold hydrolase [Actinomycetota bacterium]|jgi:alpha-beta hydrolase superfamily lysophospholipase|nr:alpha/beta fold hydrolase [Actinomycetota bacterium]
MRPRIAYLVIISSVVALLLSACGSEAPTPETSSVPTPVGELHQPPDPLPLGEPGELIWAEEVDLPIRPPAIIWRMLYHSRTVAGEDVAVSGFAFVPKADVPDGGRSVQAWAHGTVGLGDACAPSRNIRDSFPPFGYEAIQRGGIVVATDYEGLGTPGTHPYAVGVSEGRGVLDSVRAAASLPNAGPIADVILTGHSQGGAAVLFAGELAPTYAPELQIRGVVALAPGAELASLIDYLQGSPGVGATLIGAIGLSTTYPEIELSSVLTPDALAYVEEAEGECIDATVARWSGSGGDAIFTTDPLDSRAFVRIFDENSPGSVDPAVPMLILQGTDDEQVPVEISQTLATKYCDLGATVTRSTYAGIDHSGVIAAANDDVVAWIAARLAGEPNPSGCV